MAIVTNTSRGERVLALADGRHATLAPGQARDLDLADHPVHAAWLRLGQITITRPSIAAPPMPPVPPPSTPSSDGAFPAGTGVMDAATDEDLRDERKRRGRPSINRTPDVG